MNRGISFLILLAGFLILLAASPGAVKDHPVHVIMDVFEVPASAEANPADAAVVRRERWPLRFGIPVSRHSRVEDLSSIVVQGSDFAQYRVLERWPEGTVRWLQVDARVDFDPEKSSRWLLVTAGDPLAASGELARRETDDVVVETGACSFRVDRAGVVGTSAGTAVTVGFSCEAGDATLAAAADPGSPRIIENGGLRADLRADGRHGSDGPEFTTRLTFFRDRGLARLEHVITARAAVTIDRVVARIDGADGGRPTSGAGWNSRVAQGCRVTIVAPTRRSGARGADLGDDAVSWACGRIAAGESRAFELWIDLSDEDADPAALAHGVFRPLVARSVDTAQYSDTETVPVPVLAPVVARFYHARNKLPFDPSVRSERTPEDPLQEAIYDGLRDTETPAAHFVRSLALREEALDRSPEADARRDLGGLMLQARLFGDHRAAEAVAHRAPWVGRSDLALRVDLDRFLELGDGRARTEADGLAFEPIGEFESDVLNRRIRGWVRYLERSDPDVDEAVEDRVEEVSSFLLRGAWTEDGYAARFEVGADGVTAHDVRPATVDVGAALIAGYVRGGGRPVLERAREYLARAATLTGSVVPILGDSLRHDVLHLLMNLPVIATWRELPLDVVAARDGGHLVSWRVPDGAARIRLKYADRAIVRPTLGDPLTVPAGAVAFTRATNVVDEPAPAEPGSMQSVRVLGAAPGTEFAAVYLDVPQRVRREFERGPAASEIRLAGYAPEAAPDPEEPGPAGAPWARIGGGLIVAVLLLGLLVLRGRRRDRSA